jgi:hypothetical protein
MMRIPTAVLEGRKIARVIFSPGGSPPGDIGALSSLMRKTYEMGAFCFNLASPRHLRAFIDLKKLTDDKDLIGFLHVDAEEGVSFSGRPLHQLEAKVISTIKRNLFSSPVPRNVLPASSSEVLTQKEIDRISFDSSRFERALSAFDPAICPFLVVGEKYGDWLLALGRADLLKEMVAKIRARGFLPIFSGQWATFSLPKAKPLDVVAFATLISRKEGLFDAAGAFDVIKKFDRPVISLNPLAGEAPLEAAEDPLSFLFSELKIHAAVVEIASEPTARKVLQWAENVPSLTHRPKK